MQPKFFILTILMLCCFNSIGQQAKTVTIQQDNTKTIQSTVENQQEIIKQLQVENQKLHKQWEEIEKEMEWCRGDVRAEVAEMNTNMALWFSALTIVMGILGVVVPLILNKRNENSIEKLLEDAKDEAKDAAEQAKKAGKALEETEELKKHVIEIEAIINKNNISAEKAAKEAKASQLFFQALSEKDAARAIELYSRAIELEPDMVEAYINRGKCKHDIGNYAEAMIDYDDAIKLDNGDATVFFNRGNLKDDLGDKKGALKDFDKAIELDSKYVGAYINRGSVKMDLGDNTGALKDFDTAIELNPTDATSYNNRALVLMKLGEFNKALDTINDALILDGYDFRIWKTKGEICMKMDNYEVAVFAITKALALNPKDEESLKNRAACYRKMAESEQDIEKKASYLDKALADEQKAISLN